MKRLIFILSLLSFTGVGFAQTLVPAVHDLGRVKLYNNPTLVYTFTNSGKVPVMFMPTPYMLNLEINLPKGYIQPGATVQIKVRYFTEDFGSINVHQPVYINTMNDPFFINITGRIVSFHPNALSVCPSMNKTEAEVRMEQSGSPTVTIYDKNTGLTIKGADLLFTGNSKRLLIENSKNAMVTLEHVPIGLYEVVVSKEGYRTKDETLYISRGGGHFIIELTPIDSIVDPDGPIVQQPEVEEKVPEQTEEKMGDIDPEVFVFSDRRTRRSTEEKEEDLGSEVDREPEIVEPEEVVAEEQPDDSEEEVFVLDEPQPTEEHGIDRIRQMVREKYEGRTIIERDVVVINSDEDSAQEQEDVIANQPEEDPVVAEEKMAKNEALPDFDSDGQLSTKYVQSNIVFLIDVSSSMQSPEKLPLLKESMKNMVSVLRASDLVTIITYASSTKIVIASVPGNQKEDIYRIIDSLSAFGYSRGADGMDLAYSQAMRNFITNGNNQVILATDGMFNSNDVTDDDLYKVARYYSKDNGIHLSVVAFGKSKSAISFMRNLSRNGDGSYIRIDPESGENKELVMEIMKHALK